MAPCILVIGQIGRDLVLTVDAFPPVGGSSPVSRRLEMLGGKGANQAVGLRQLGGNVALLAVAGTDQVGDDLVAAARQDGIDVAAVGRRGDSALLVDVVDADGHRRLLEHIPESSLLTAQDVRAAAASFATADTVCLQLQQRPEALVQAAHLATDTGARIVLDGSIDGEARHELLAAAHVVRADAHEAELLTGIRPEDPDRALTAAHRLLEAGVEVAAIGVAGTGDLVAWDDGHHLFPFSQTDVVDPTGAGDAFLAGLITGLRAGSPPQQAGELAAACAASTVQRAGGRPDLSHLRTR